jgi:hypothetical protein
MAVSAALATEGLIGFAEKLRSGNTKFALLNAPSTAAAVTFTGGVGTVAAQTWTTGTRVRFRLDNFFGGASIAPANTTTDYFLIRNSATAFRVATTAANAASGQSIAVPDFGAGNYSLELAKPSANWTVAELVAVELVHPQYDRLVVPTTLGAVVMVGAIAQLDLNLATITNTNATPYAYNAIVLIKNGGAKGTATGTLLDALPLTPVSIAQNTAYSITHRLTMQ